MFQDEQSCADHFLHIFSALLDSHFFANEAGKGFFWFLSRKLFSLCAMGGMMCMSHLVALG